MDGRDGSATVLLTTRDGIVVTRVLAPAEHALATLADLANDFGNTGLWPVIVANDSPLPGFDELGRFVKDGSATRAAPVGEILQLADQLDATAVLESRWADSLPIDAKLTIRAHLHSLTKRRREGLCDQSRRG